MIVIYWINTASVISKWGIFSPFLSLVMSLLVSWLAPSHPRRIWLPLLLCCNQILVLSNYSRLWWHFQFLPGKNHPLIFLNLLQLEGFLLYKSRVERSADLRRTFATYLETLFRDLMISPLSFFTLPTGQGTNLPLISFIIFQVFLEAPCWLACSSSAICISMKRLSSSRWDAWTCFARSFHLSFVAADFLWWYLRLTVCLLATSVRIASKTHFFETTFWWISNHSLCSFSDYFSNAFVNLFGILIIIWESIKAIFEFYLVLLTYLLVFNSFIPVIFYSVRWCLFKFPEANSEICADSSVIWI